MPNPLIRLLERIAPVARVVLLLAAVILLGLGWIMPLFVAPEHRPTWEACRSLAAIPATVWGLLDALLANARRKQLPIQDEIQSEIYEVLREVESLAVEHASPVRLSECGIKVWAVVKPSVIDRMWRKEERARLVRVATSSLYRATASSGLKWRVGMGVIGMALKTNDILAVNVDELWRPLRNCTEDEWDRQPEMTRLGLTFDEFKKLCRLGNGAVPAGPFVIAVPYYSNGRPVGVVALNMPSSAAESIHLGGRYDEGDESVTSLMYALGAKVFRR